MASYTTYLVEQVRNSILTHIKTGCLCCIESQKWDDAIRNGVEDYCERFGISLEPRIDIESEVEARIEARKAARK